MGLQRLKLRRHGAAVLGLTNDQVEPQNTQIQCVEKYIYIYNICHYNGLFNEMIYTIHFEGNFPPFTKDTCRRCMENGFCSQNLELVVIFSRDSSEDLMEPLAAFVILQF